MLLYGFNYQIISDFFHIHNFYMKILLTGANGMLGKEIVYYFKLEYPQIALLPIDIDNLDITRGEEVLDYFFKERPEFVIHCAAYTDVDRAEEQKEIAYKVNSRGTDNIAKACNNINATMVYNSTDFVFDGNKIEPYVERDPAYPISVYGNSKYKGELAVCEQLEKYFILRISWLYGRYKKNFVTTIGKLAEEKDSLQVVDDQYGTPTHTLDVARILIPLIESNKYGIYHFSGEGSCSWNEFAKEFLKLAGIDIPIYGISSEKLARLAKRPKNSIMSKEKIKKLLGITIKDWRESLKEYIKLIDA